ncbi:hypothetical protein LIER_37106 [Lithospermum erythrorhizon]|uniref:Uncharacterized protein n=1 Tax=Lithospermum erythrorhizon TaxID=34254 RepID=A0AAV3PFB0_LITER
MGLLAPRAAPGQTTYNALPPFLNQAEMQRAKSWAQAPKSSMKSLALAIGKEASASMALADSESALYQHALELDGELSREGTKVDRLREKLQELHRQVVAVEHLPGERALMAHYLQREEERTRGDHQRAKRRWVVVLHIAQSQVPQLPVLAVEYKRWYPARSASLLNKRGFGPLISRVVGYTQSGLRFALGSRSPIDFSSPL